MKYDRGDPALGVVVEFSDVKITVLKKVETGEVFEEYAGEEA